MKLFRLAVITLALGAMVGCGGSTGGTGGSGGGSGGSDGGTGGGTAGGAGGGTAGGAGGGTAGGAGGGTAGGAGGGTAGGAGGGTAGGAGGGTAGGAGGGTAGGAGGGTAGGAGGGTAGGAGGGTAGGAGGGTGGGTGTTCPSTYAGGSCATPIDLTAATSPSFNFGSLAFNTQSCIKVKTSQLVSITGITGTSHPTSDQDCGPANVLTAQAINFVQQFTVAGTYGIHCSNHPGMVLAIQVVP